jgi:SAM-dependent methyltransferase
VGWRIVRPGVRAGYDRWAEVYDETPSSLVALDRRKTSSHLAARPGERILDAGCGTGVHLRSLRRAGARPVGMDLSLGMLAQARRRNREARLVLADLHRPWPVGRGRFDAVLCALVSEHLTDLASFFAEALAALVPGGRLVFSAFHPVMAAAGVEANFRRDGIEYRLGAELHTTDDYLTGIRRAGFEEVRWREYRGNASLAEEVPSAAKYLGRPLLLVIEGSRPVPRAQ